MAKNPTKDKYSTNIKSVSTQRTLLDNGNYSNVFEQASVDDVDGFRQYYKQSTPGSFIHYAGSPEFKEQLRVNNSYISDPFLTNFLYNRAGYQATQKKNGGPVYNWIPPNYPRVGARNEQGGWLEKYANGGKVGKYARKGETYNEKRATELGYTPDAIGHLPSVDYETSNWLKSAQHPTAWKEHLYGYLLNPAVSTGYNLGFDFGGYFGKNQLKYYPKKEDGGTIEDQKIPTPTTPSYYPDYPDRTLTNYQMGTPKAPMYAAGSTVWTKQTTPTWVAGTPTPTATQNFRNDRSLNTDRYRIGDVVPTGMDYKSPAAGTYDYSKDIQPYHTMRLHAPSTTKMARNGGQVTEEYKKRAGIPYAINPGVSAPEGVYTGPTTQRGITFADGGDVPPYVTSDPKEFARRKKAYSDSLALFNSAYNFDSDRSWGKDEHGHPEGLYGNASFEQLSPFEKREVKEEKIYVNNPNKINKNIKPTGREYMLHKWGASAIDLYKKPIQKIILEELLPMRGLPSDNIEAMPQKVNVLESNPLPPQYMDTRGEWSSTPQTPPVYTPEQLLKMGYRAPQKKANGGWLDSYEEGGDIDLKEVKPSTTGGLTASVYRGGYEHPIFGGHLAHNFGGKWNPYLEGFAGYRPERSMMITGEAGVSPHIQKGDFIFNPSAKVGLTGGVKPGEDIYTTDPSTGFISNTRTSPKSTGNIYSKAGLKVMYRGLPKDIYIHPYAAAEYKKDPYEDSLPISLGVDFTPLPHTFYQLSYDPLNHRWGTGINISFGGEKNPYKYKKKPKVSTSRYNTPEKKADGGWLDNL